MYPTEWYWRNGKITNNKDRGIECLYFDFMVWKGGRWGKLHGGGQWENLKSLVHFDYREAHSGWKINKGGFFAIEDNLSESLGRHASWVALSARAFVDKVLS